MTTTTEALAEIKTINKRIDTKRAFIHQYISRQDGNRDPLEGGGGSFVAIQQQRQAISDLGQRIVDLRGAIQQSNMLRDLTINGKTKSIADWLIWRRDIAPSEQAFLASTRSKLANVRETAKRMGASVVPHGAQPEKLVDLIINLDETKLAADAEWLETTLGELDGKLSLANATVEIGL